MPATSVVSNPLWDLHLSEIGNWSSPLFSIDQRKTSLLEVFSKEESLAKTLWLDSKPLTDPSQYSPFALPEDVASVHRNKNILMFEHVLRQVEDPWGHPAASPFRKGFRTVGPIEETPLWDKCELKKQPQGQANPSYAEALDALHQEAHDREPAPFEAASVLKQGWEPTKKMLLSGAMHLKEIPKPSKGLVIFSFYLPQKWSYQLGAFTKVRLIANERPKNRSLSAITKKLSLASHKYLISLFTRCLHQQSDEDPTSLKARALETLRFADKTAPLNYSELEPPLKKVRANKVSMFTKAFDIIEPRTLYVLLSDMKSSKLPKPYRAAFRRCPELDPYRVGMPTASNCVVISGSIVILKIRLGMFPPSVKDPVSQRISRFKKTLSEAMASVDISLYDKVVFPAALATSTYQEHLEHLSPVIDQQNARSTKQHEVWLNPDQKLRDAFRSVWGVPPKPQAPLESPLSTPPFVVSKIDLNAAYYQLGVERGETNILAVFDPEAWSWRYFNARSMTFGNVHSVFSFVRLTTQLSIYLYKRYKIIMVPYIDDFIIVSLAALAPLEFHIVKSFLAQLGLQISSKKDGCILGRLDTEIDLLGINYTFSKASFRISIPDDKLISAHEKLDLVINTLKEGKNPSIKDLLSMYGTISFLTYFRRYKKELIYMTLLNKLLAAEADPQLSAKDKVSLITLITSAKLLINCRQCLEVSAEHLNRELAFMFTDAMKDKDRIGAGSILYRHDGSAEYGQFSSYDIALVEEFSILHLEALTPLLHIAGSKSLSNVNLIIFVDNAGAVLALAKQCSKDASLAAIVSMTWSTLARKNINVWFSYINTKRNPSDEASRLDSFEDFIKSNSNLKFSKIEYPLESILREQRELSSKLSALLLNSCR